MIHVDLSWTKGSRRASTSMSPEVWPAGVPSPDLQNKHFSGGAQILRAVSKILYAWVIWAFPLFINN